MVPVVGNQDHPKLIDKNGNVFATVRNPEIAKYCPDIMNHKWMPAPIEYRIYSANIIDAHDRIG